MTKGFCKKAIASVATSVGSVKVYIDHNAKRVKSCLASETIQIGRTADKSCSIGRSLTVT
jgi:hypothetical protein